jgi:hypothetical protein
MPARRPPTKSGGGGGKGAMIGVAGLLLLGAVGGGAYFMMKGQSGPAEPTSDPTPVADVPPTAAPSAAPPEAVVTEPPPTEAAPTPVEVVEVVTVVRPTAQAATPAASPAAAASPSAARPTVRPTRGAVTAAPATAVPAAAQASALRAQADSAYASGQFDSAISQYDEALRLAPQDGAASAGRSRAVAARDSLKRRFVPGTTRVRSGKAAKGDISGFESGDVTVAKALDYSGRVDFEVQPERVRAGMPFTIRISLTNDGKKGWKSSGAVATITANGAASTPPVAAPTRELEPQQAVSLGELSGTWGEGVTAWKLEVVVTSNRGDTFKNTLTWR